MARKTAKQQLTQNLTAARANLVKLAAEIDKLEREANAQPKSWAYAGSVGKVAEAIADEVECLGGTPDHCVWDR